MSDMPWTHFVKTATVTATVCCKSRAQQRITEEYMLLILRL